MTLSKLTCPACAVVLTLKTEMPAGKMIKCPKCAKVFPVPAGSAAAAAAAPAQPLAKTATKLPSQPPAKTAPKSPSQPPAKPAPKPVPAAVGGIAASAGAAQPKPANEAPARPSSERSLARRSLDLSLKGSVGLARFVFTNPSKKKAILCGAAGLCFLLLLFAGYKSIASFFSRDPALAQKSSSSSDPALARNSSSSPVDKSSSSSGEPSATNGSSPATARGQSVRAKTPELDLSRLRLATKHEWKGTYDQAQKKWNLAYNAYQKEGAFIIEQLPANFPTKMEEYAGKLVDKDFQDPGFQYTEITEKTELPDGFFLKGLVKNVNDPTAKPMLGLVMVRNINGAKIRCRSTKINHEDVRKGAMDILKEATINIHALFAARFPRGWAMTPDNVTLILSQTEQAQLAYFDTVADKEVKRVEVDFKPGALAIQGDTLFAAGHGSAIVYALDLKTAKVKKEFNVGGDAVSFLACHPAKGLLYASTTKFEVYSIDPASSAVSKTKAKGHFLAIDPLAGKFLYTGIQPPDRDEIEFQEGADGSFRIFFDRWGRRAMLFKYAVNDKALDFVSGQNNAAVNGWSMHLSPDGKRLAFVGGGGWRPKADGAGGGYVTAVFSTDNLETMLGQAPKGLEIAFHPVLNLGVISEFGAKLQLFNAKSLVPKKTPIFITKDDERRPACLTFGARGRKIVLWNGEDFKKEQGLHFIPWELSEEDQAALDNHYGK